MFSFTSSTGRRFIAGRLLPISARVSVDGAVRSRKSADWRALRRALPNNTDQKFPIVWHKRSTSLLWHGHTGKLPTKPRIAESLALPVPRNVLSTRVQVQLCEDRFSCSVPATILCSPRVDASFAHYDNFCCVFRSSSWTNTGAWFSVASNYLSGSLPVDVFSMNGHRSANQSCGSEIECRNLFVFRIRPLKL
jgi:hypothetical protein